MGKLSGQTAVVTGASRGIGKAIAELYAQEGANLALVATKAESVAQLAQSLSAAHGIKAVGYGCDVSNATQVEETVKAILADFSAVEILVNNAGITRDGLLMRMKEDDWDSVLDVNLKSVFLLCKAFCRPMLKQKYGRIINMSSINGIVAQAGQANYAASKAGVIGITKSLAKEFAAKNITVNAIAPGFIQTDMTAALTPEQVEGVKKFIPSGELGEAIDIANAALFLGSKEARYITGQVLSVDGGMNA